MEAGKGTLHVIYLKNSHFRVRMNRTGSKEMVQNMSTSVFGA